MSKDIDLEIEKMIRANYNVVVVMTSEEGRAISLINRVCETKLDKDTANRNAGKGRTLVCWDFADGFKQISPHVVSGEGKAAGPYDFQPEGLPPKPDPLSALQVIGAYNKQAVFILKDFHEFWEQPIIKRKLRNLAQRLEPSGKCIFITSPNKRVPDELKDDIGVIDLPMPREHELNELLGTVAQSNAIKVELDDEQKQRFLQAALGLTSQHAKRVLTKAAVVSKGKINESHIKMITEEKRQVIRQSEALEFFPVSETMDDIGGLEQLKEWLQIRQGAFSEAAREFELPPPKGVALIGIPGTGKSLTAKAIGAIWRLPLLKLDVGALFGGIVGESEERTRRALHVAETVAPCILWIDELEKAFAQGGLDGGTSSRVFGSILTWMQDKTSPVFVVATANDISKLPPELLRKGRFDEVFFLDLPTEEERKQIFAVQLKRVRRPLHAFDLDGLARASEYFVGAEIENAINDALYQAFYDGQRAMVTDDIIRSLKKLIPLAESQREVVGKLRSWLKEGRAISASYSDKKQALSNAVHIERLDIMGDDEEAEATAGKSK
jgi:ATP-dependent 26S proteasome regulatory subunit